MWIFILIILGIIIGKYAFDNLRQNSAMKQSGGMAVKYAELVDACLACSDARILQETPTFISIGGKYREHNITIDYAFWIQHTFNNKLIIKYVLKGSNTHQKIVKTWDFSQSISQNQMVNAMREYLSELKCNQTSNNALDKSKFISSRYSKLIQRLKMEGSENFNLYTIEVIEDTLLKYRFKLNMKFASYTYTIMFWHGSGKLLVILDSTNYIKGRWEFSLAMDQNEIADKIENDIDTMVKNRYENGDFYN